MTNEQIIFAASALWCGLWGSAAQIWFLNRYIINGNIRNPIARIALFGLSFVAGVVVSGIVFGLTLDLLAFFGF